MKNLPSNSALKAFIASAQHLSFTQAALDLNITAGAISRQIQSLEGYLGKKLFVRQHKHIELTETGRVYLAEIRGPLTRIDAATARLRNTQRTRTFSICAYPTFAIRWLIPRWGSLYDRYPDLDVRLTTSLNPAEFGQGEYDMAIQVMPEGEKIKGLETVKLMDINMYPVASPEVAANIKNYDDLKKYQFLHGNPRPLDWHRWLESAGISNLDPEQGMRFESSNLALHAAIEGLGVTMGIEALIESDLKSGKLVKLFDISRISDSPFQLVYPTTRKNDPVVTNVRDWLLEQVSA
jgi:LysR family transcriptional regulator, glycine cleavage system transcriptional activator